MIDDLSERRKLAGMFTNGVTSGHRLGKLRQKLVMKGISGKCWAQILCVAFCVIYTVVS